MDNSQIELRKRYKTAKAKVISLGVKREQIEKPFREKMKAATEHLVAAEAVAAQTLDEIEDQLPMYLGRCEICGVDIFEGDTGFRYGDDDIYYCEEHSPTNGETLDMVKSAGPESYDDAQHYQHTVEHLQGLPADEKHVWQL